MTPTLSKERALASAGSHKKKKNLLKNSQDTKSTKTSHSHSVTVSQFHSVTAAQQTDDRVYYQNSRYSETCAESLPICRNSWGSIISTAAACASKYNPETEEIHSGCGDDTGRVHRKCAMFVFIEIFGVYASSCSQVFLSFQTHEPLQLATRGLLEPAHSGSLNFRSYSFNLA